MILVFDGGCVAVKDEIKLYIFQTRSLTQIFCIEVRKRMVCSRMWQDAFLNLTNELFYFTFFIVHKWEKWQESSFVNERYSELFILAIQLQVFLILDDSTLSLYTVKTRIMTIWFLQVSPS